MARSHLRVVQQAPPEQPPSLPRIPLREQAAEVWRRAVLVAVALSGAVYIGICVWIATGLLWILDEPHAVQAFAAVLLVVLLRLVYRAGWIVWRSMVRPQAPQVEVVEHRHYHVTPEN